MPSAYKIALYGVEGIGKSTLASKFPDPVFIDTEDSTKTMDVARFDKPTSWTMLLDEVDYVIKNPSCCRTLVIDTADWAEQLCIAELCDKNNWASLESPGYGKGYQYSAEAFGKLLNKLSEVTQRGIHVVVTAHAWLRKVELPDEMGAYDHWEMKTSKKVAPMIREWTDAVFFANYKTIVVNVDGQGAQKGKNKAQGGKRMLYTTHTPFWDAKNRFGLPDELPLDYAPLAPYFETPAPTEKSTPKQAKAASSLKEGTPPAQAPKEVPPTHTAPPPPPASEKMPDAAPKGNQGAGQPDDMAVPQKLRPLLESADVTEQEVREVIAARKGGYFPMGTTWKVMQDAGFVDGWVIPNWDKIVKMIQDDPDRLPF